MKKFNYMIIVLGLAVSAPSYAVHLRVDTKCPATAKVGAALIVSESIKNNNCNTAATVSKSLTGLVGNGGGIVGLQGPYVTTLNPARTVPKAICDKYGQVVTPGVLNLSNLVVMSKISTSLGGTLAMASSGVIQADGTISAGACSITISP